MLSGGIDNKVFRRLELEGKIERISKGFYFDAEQMVDDYIIMQYRCKKGIFLQYALVETERALSFFYMKIEFHEIGKMKVQSPYGHTIVVYDKERTICDCLKKG